MPKYIYEASKPNGSIVKGEFESNSRDGVAHYLSTKDLLPLKIQAIGEEKGNLNNTLSLHLFERVTHLDRIIITRNLAATLKAGLNLVESLDILVDDTNNTLVKKILTEAKENLQNGQQLSQTFSRYPEYFPPYFIGMIRAGEGSGKLETTLLELSVYLNREFELVKKINSALAYPIILLFGSFGVVTLLIVFVLPKIEKMFAQTKISLPMITKVLLFISSILTYSILLDLGFIILLVGIILFLKKSIIGRKITTFVLMRLPISGDLLRKIALVRFTRTLGSMLASGSPIIRALEGAAESSGNIYYQESVKKSALDVSHGLTISASLSKDRNLFPKFLTSLIAVGERTGSLEYVLKTFSTFYDDEVDNTLKSLTTLLEPLLLLLMGGIIGSIALAILLPIFRLVSSFS